LPIFVAHFHTGNHSLKNHIVAPSLIDLTSTTDRREVSARFLPQYANPIHCVCAVVSDSVTRLRLYQPVDNGPGNDYEADRMEYRWRLHFFGRPEEEVYSEFKDWYPKARGPPSQEIVQRLAKQIGLECVDESLGLLGFRTTVLTHRLLPSSWQGEYQENLSEALKGIELPGTS